MSSRSTGRGDDDSIGCRCAWVVFFMWPSISRLAMAMIALACSFPHTNSTIVQQGNLLPPLLVSSRAFERSRHAAYIVSAQRLKPTRRSNIRRTHQEQQRDTPAVTAGCAGLVVIAAAATTAAAAAAAETKSEVHLLHCSLEQRVGWQVCLSDDQSASVGIVEREREEEEEGGGRRPLYSLAMGTAELGSAKQRVEHAFPTRRPLPPSAAPLVLNDNHLFFPPLAFRRFLQL
ncbi:hypothetical protein B296_00037720 [Ensete ventricosum]|uniref:Uncharacterized protein n=1 Tax=Ensete ventricosum TaxID=4639 RepID=A0A426YM12_ENSVE|nr:hypothetical protein B296_00037720 [Ensete ventricosum]